MMNVSSRKPPAPSRSIVGNSDLKIWIASGASCLMRLAERRRGAAEDEREQADPDPPRDGERQALAERAARRAAQPEQRAGMLGHGMPAGHAEVAPREQPRSPTTNRTIATSAPGTSDSQSAWPVSGWKWAVQPHQVRFASGANAGTAPW